MKHINDYFWAKKTAEENSRLLWFTINSTLRKTRKILQASYGNIG